MEKFNEGDTNPVDRIISPEQARKTIRHFITDWANEIAGLTFYDNDIVEFQKYVTQSHNLGIYEKYNKTFKDNGLDRFPDLMEQINKIDVLTKRFLLSTNPMEFKRLVNAIFFLIYPNRGAIVCIRKKNSVPSMFYRINIL